MLSLSMIVRDEAPRLERCLQSVAGFVDEMVVMDTGSRDGTEAIAERCGAVVHRIEWPGDFAPARNRALELVSGDWVLVLDADEELRSEVREPLRALMREPDLLLINLLREEQGAAQSPYSSVSRLFRRHPGIHWSRAYHAMVDDSVAELRRQAPHWRVASFDRPALIHSGYSPELLARGAKAQRLRQAMEEELQRRPGDPYACAKLGALEVSEGNRQRGIALLEEGLAQGETCSEPERYELLLHLAIARAADQPAAATALYRQALALPLDPRISLAARLNLGALLQTHGQLEEALALTVDATAAAPELAIAWYNLGLIQRQRGDLAAAIAAYRQAVALAPAHPESRQNLAVALLLGGNVAEARQGFREAIQLLQQQGRSVEAEELERRARTVVNLEA
jgi:tetratricopeptide (TPR) repeat protein